MPEIELHIHRAGQEPREIVVSPELEAAEFIREYVKLSQLPEDEIWEADDKDTGQTLVAGRTLHHNGVRNGHHLYFKSRPKSVKKPEPPVVPEPVPPRDGSPPKWPLVVAVLLIPVAGITSYFWAKGQNKTARTVLLDAQAAAAAANQRATDAEAKVKQLQEQLKGGVDSHIAEINALNTQLNQLKQDADRKENQLKAANQAKMAELTKNADDLRAAVAGDQDQIKRLQASLKSSEEQVTKLQNVVDAQIKVIQNQQPPTSGKQSGKEKQPPPVRPNYGWLVWTGDPKGNLVEIRDNRAFVGSSVVGSLSGKPLPGVPCTLELLDPETASIEFPPDAATGWNRVAFRSKHRGTITVHLVWGVR
jgi:hypothetical protein